MKIDIIVVYVNRYEFGHEKHFVPSITGIHLAALTPKKHKVNVIHQQVDKINYESDADLIALSFFSGFAIEAYNIALKFKSRKKTVIAGGPHVTYLIDEAIKYFDSVITGEAESVWGNVLKDFEQGKLSSIYRGGLDEFKNIPTPRYDLLPDKYFIKKVVQATRGCAFSCSFCSVPTLNPGFKTRPVDDVIKDISYDKFNHWWQNKVVWFWDDNLTLDREFVKELLVKIIPLNKWWLTQASIDIVNDEELLSLMEKSGCIGIFFGIESFNKDSLNDCNKKQNQIEKYKKAVKKLHKRGIAVMAGLISGFDHDSHESITDMADKLMETGIDVPFLSVLTPFKGTNLYEKLETENRLMKNRNWSFYNGYNVAFYPKNMNPEKLLNAHRQLWKNSFCIKNSLIRILKGAFTLRIGAFFLSLFMNVFYCLKKIRKNFPMDMSKINYNIKYQKNKNCVKKKHLNV